MFLLIGDLQYYSQCNVYTHTKYNCYNCTHNISHCIVVAIMNLFPSSYCLSCSNISPSIFFLMMCVFYSYAIVGMEVFGSEDTTVYPGCW